MSNASDFLKAALERKRQQSAKPGKKDKSAPDGGSEVVEQVVMNKPQKKTTGRGR
jgi:hypothetical protein